MDELVHKLEKISEIEGSGTQLVSLYIPASKSISSIVNRLQSEHAEAENIKSKQTRESVQRALKMALNELRAVQNEYDGSLVLFAGIDSESTEHSYVLTDVDAQSFRYHCDSQFLVEPALDQTREHDEYGLIVIERREATIGKLVGDLIQHEQDLSSDAKGKHNAGGFSNRRFDRLIEESTDTFYNEVATAALDTFDPDSLSGVIVGGSNITKDDFVDHLHISLEEQVKGTFNVAYSGWTGLEQLVSKADDTIESDKEQSSRQICNQFFEALRNDSAVTYGYDRVDRATRLGAVDTLIVSEDVFFEDDVAGLRTDVEQMGGTVASVPTEFEKGIQFHELSGGVGALLRFEV